jgi:hypothetical protein
MALRRYSLFIYFTAALIYVCNLAWSSADNCQFALNGPVPTSFQKNQNLYRPRLCCDNVYYWIEKIKAEYPQFDLNQIEVLYIYSRWSRETTYLHGFNYFTPLLARIGGPSFWGFHTILKYQNHIFDFDYSLDPAALPVTDYFKSMFGAHWNFVDGSWKYQEIRQNCRDCDIDLPAGAQLQFHIRAIPAPVYLNEYLPSQVQQLQYKTKNYNYWLTTDKEFPDRLLSEYLWPYNTNY